MRLWYRTSRKARWLGLMLVIGILLATVAILAQRDTAAITAQSATATALYLPDPAAPALDLAVARQRGIRVVVSPTELLNVAASTNTGAVLLDRAMFDALPAEWLAGQVRQGRIVVGLNVPADRFTQLPGLDGNLSTANMLLDWQGTPFYSWAYQLEIGGQIKNSGLHSDAIYSTGTFLDGLGSTLDGLAIARARATGTEPARPIQPRPAR